MKARTLWDPPTGDPKQVVIMGFSRGKPIAMFEDPDDDSIFLLTEDSYVREDSDN